MSLLQYDYHRNQATPGGRSTVWDRMRLKDTFSSINDTTQNVCNKCRREFLQKDVLVKVACCSGQFHRRCPLEVASCPLCTLVWCGLWCVKCRGLTMQRDELESHRMFERRCCNRIACCGVDIHPNCKSMVVRSGSGRGLSTMSHWCLGPCTEEAASASAQVSVSD